MRDFKRLQTDPPEGISGAPCDNNIMLWHAVIFGPEDTPWEGGTFKLMLQFTEDYPNKAPTVKFLSKMFHPNVYADGAICLDILQNMWTPIYDIAAILTSIQSLLSDPNPNSPANAEAAKMVQENKREYNRRVREIVEQSWLLDATGAPLPLDPPVAAPAAAPATGLAGSISTPAAAAVAPEAPPAAAAPAQGSVANAAAAPPVQPAAT